MMNVKPKKYLGQHFLLDNTVSQRIAEAIKIENKVNLLEIGPGTGALTQFLMGENINLIAYELDKESTIYLNENFPKLTVHNQDILKIEWKSIFNDNFSVTGNFPYNISSQIMFKIYENRDIIDQMVGMFQKEVAERICSSTGTKKYGILSVLIQAFYNVDYLFTVNEDAFNPPPKVKSGVIRIERNDVIKLDCDEKLFFRVVKAIFNQRRKMARNSLKSMLGDLKIDHVLLTKRPEQLSVENFIEITKLLESEIK
ncbi:MAG: 16S rRNA (adenine(1518)-N(6)/adenine(1519)-N(6))-dimethyltransferase RsmA [Flavobacteriales bacterium]|nr:16S rRNA (adenine(1518)-N(6)/adenine(1519)-N(6))-dimethyltransferase RsmA [Flavobacteriales bacterium]